MKLVVKDCSPFNPQPTAAEADWLRNVAAHVMASDLVISISDQREEDEPLVYCSWDGTWWAGRYVGTLTYQGSSLTIEPRFGLDILRNWLFEATSVLLTETPGRLHTDDSFVVQLLAYVWSQGFVEAARHGLPALRQDISLKGPTIRGRLDVASSLRLIASKSQQIISVRSEKSLDHAASNAIVAAYSILKRWLGIPDDRWMPPRAKELIPHLISITGPRPRVPTKAELDRIRYTPITAPFAPFAELSRQIANRNGLDSDVDAKGESKGMLLDVAELWEMYVLSILRKSANPQLLIKHGTKERVASKKLLHSAINGQGLGTLIPDAILYKQNTIQGVADAKYKSLHPSANAPNGPQREDLYQMAAYLGRFKNDKYQSSWGLLIYPEDPRNPETPKAEELNPWLLDSQNKLLFCTLPHTSKEAVLKLKDVINP